MSSLTFLFTLFLFGASVGGTPAASLSPHQKGAETWLLVPGSLTPENTDDYPGIQRGTPASCPLNSKGVPGNILSFRTNSQAHQGADDDTALNGVEFKCFDGSVVKSAEGPLGDWSPWQGCSGNLIFTGLRLKVEHADEEGADRSDAAGVVSVKIHCEDKTEVEALGARSFGHWEEYPTVCDQYQHFCGFASYIQGPQGKSKDDLGMSGVGIRCCQNND